MFSKGKKEIKIRKILSLLIISLIIIFVPVLISGLYNKKEANVNEISLIKEDFFSYHLNEHIINSGEVFVKLNTALNLNSQQLQELLEISKNVYNLSQIKVGNGIKAFFDPNNNEFQKLEYEIDKDNILVIEKQENGQLKAEKRTIEYEVKLDKIDGKVENSLYQAGQKAGLKDKTIMEMADIFAWDIDFGIEVREGDEFEVLYEKKFFDGKEVYVGKILMAKYKNNNKDYWAIYYKDAENREDYYDLEGNCLRKQFLRAPVNYKYISSGYSLSRFHPVWGVYTTHQAIDYAAPCGTPVSASGAGTVIFVGWKNNVYGRTIEIRHNGVYTTRYAHLSGYAKGIKYGTKVVQGQIIGFVGTSGTSTGCHLDYAMKKYNSFVNPLTQNFERSEPIKEIHRENFNIYKEALLRLFNSG
ncbi:MAG: peptidoglycan DD-metalloendopeptidase family protein [Patescibacteria group bacterium]|jgi:murein DD-endopeptidase MepM/ murein hydrolase activator NlpD|nr:peptidoglycan DD-metalloendopeptidase family protein [Patescibacteria group bacterium]MDD5172709.1 peptidoglycan DD-metalloendopeptidase family protein [Patescibacteria group bacterium]